ncbi:MAG: endopeptidase La [Defluviitaleaceae bacterium]|nr:endopeptidase La [Defluviitaleaceae bacterium]
MNIDVKQNEEVILPLMPVRGIVPLPYNELTLEVGRPKSIEALLAAEETENYILLSPQEDVESGFPDKNSLYEIGLVAKIVNQVRQPNGHYRVKFKILIRAQIEEVIETEGFFKAQISTMPSFSEESGDEEVMGRMLLKEINNPSSRLFSRSMELRRVVKTKPSLELLTDVAAFSLKISDENKFKYLSIVDVSERLNTILEDIEAEKQAIELENKINNEMRKNVEQHQKDYILREKVKAIHKELGDEASTNAAVEKFRTRLKKAGMPKHAAKKVEEEIKRFEMTPTQAADSGVLRNYIEWMLDIPWSKVTRDKKDLAFAEETLDDQHYGLEKVKDRILEYLAVKVMTGKTPPAILCLSGPPGVGKTSLAKSIATSLGRKFVKMSLGGVRDEAEIRGHRRTYIGSMPGRIIQGMKKAGTINPVFLLDEIDKMASDFRGDPGAALLEVLDPEQNANFSDHYLEEEYDLSKVLFIATANDLSRIPGPLRDRMDIITVSSYTEIEKFEIAKRHLIEKQMEAHGLNETQLVFENESIVEMIQYYTKEAGVRQLERTIAEVCRKSARQLLMTEEKFTIGLNGEKLVEMLGKHKFVYNLADQEDQVGAVTGLAYTQAGGDILPIEVAYFKGAGKIVLTGKLGDVMKESARIAVSYVRSRAQEFEIDEELFEKNDIHIHVPDGATPKDGPSAGITMTTAIISAFTGQKVRRDVGMTGEVTLRGRVGAIGGLKEKSISAHRSGIKTIVIPKENEKDIDDIPQTVQNELTIVPVTTIDEVLATALVK